MTDDKKTSGELNPSQVYNLFDLAEYAEGSVVSRTIAKNQTGTCTLFAFDSGQGLSEHSAPFDALVQIVDGQALVTIGGEKITVSKGELVMMPANIPHALQAEKRFKMLLTMFKEK
ncbi:MAG: cupin domain-containing protein [candidate division Zixibacteria bacterium]|nr:cupin domain-containing protein [candidate division Zixibacteria bacterium]